MGAQADRALRDLAESREAAWHDVIERGPVLMLLAQIQHVAPEIIIGTGRYLVLEGIHSGDQAPHEAAYRTYRRVQEVPDRHTAQLLSGQARQRATLPGHRPRPDYTRGLLIWQE